MASYMEEYKRKLVTADEAVKVVKSGDWVEMGWCVGAPNVLDKALAKRKDELTDVKLRGGVQIWPMHCMQADPEGKTFTWVDWHFSGQVRKLYDAGLAYYAPIKYCELPRYIRQEVEAVDVLMCQVAPMDKHGFFNFGPQTSHMMALAERAKVIIVEVNEKMPRVLGGREEAIHISRVDYIVEGDNADLPQLPAVPPTEVDQAVAKLIVEEIVDGATIQLGIGGMPNAVGAMIAQSDLKDLGVHTEMFVDAYVDMFDAGKITGARKNIDRYKMVFAFAAGTQKLYDLVDDNPMVAGYPVDYTNHPSTVALFDNFVSINNAIEVDLFGQVCAESAGWRHISGTGGQLDFVQGAYDSRGGKSFICLSSTFTDKNGNMKSRIVPTLTPGAITTDPRTATHYVVTEYGKANLKGRSTWQRAEALINIAHPDLREDLIKEAEKMKIWRKTNKIS